MGVDFIRRVAKTFKKSWDHSRVDLATRELFTREPLCITRISVARDLGTERLTQGVRVIVRIDGDGLTAVIGTLRVARLVNPSQSLVAAIESAGGYANGVIGAREQGNDILEISIC